MNHLKTRSPRRELEKKLPTLKSPRRLCKFIRLSRCASGVLDDVKKSREAARSSRFSLGGVWRRAKFSNGVVAKVYAFTDALTLEFLKSVDVLRGCKEEDLAYVVSTMWLVEANSGSVVHNQGAMVDTVHLIMNGECTLERVPKKAKSRITNSARMILGRKIHKHNRVGGEVTRSTSVGGGGSKVAVALLGPGQFVGFSDLLIKGGSVHYARARARTHLRMLAVRATDLLTWPPLVLDKLRVLARLHTEIYAQRVDAAGFEALRAPSPPPPPPSSHQLPTISLPPPSRHHLPPCVALPSGGALAREYHDDNLLDSDDVLVLRPIEGRFQRQRQQRSGRLQHTSAYCPVPSKSQTLPEFYERLESAAAASTSSSEWGAKGRPWGPPDRDLTNDLFRRNHTQQLPIISSAAPAPSSAPLHSQVPPDAPHGRPAPAPPLRAVVGRRSEGERGYAQHGAPPAAAQQAAKPLVSARGIDKEEAEMTPQMPLHPSRGLDKNWRKSARIKRGDPMRIVVTRRETLKRDDRIIQEAEPLLSIGRDLPKRGKSVMSAPMKLNHPSAPNKAPTPTKTGHQLEHPQSDEVRRVGGSHGSGGASVESAHSTSSRLFHDSSIAPKSLKRNLLEGLMTRVRAKPVYGSSKEERRLGEGTQYEILEDGQVSLLVYDSDDSTRYGLRKPLAKPERRRVEECVVSYQREVDAKKQDQILLHRAIKPYRRIPTQYAIKVLD